MTAKRSLISWCIYDWANSAYPTVITTFVFATYFTKAIAETPERGTDQLGVALGIGGLVVALTSPVLGAIATVLAHANPGSPYSPHFASLRQQCCGTRNPSLTMRFGR